MKKRSVQVRALARASRSVMLTTRTAILGPRYEYPLPPRLRELPPLARARTAQSHAGDAAFWAVYGNAGALSKTRCVSITHLRRLVQGLGRASGSGVVAGPGFAG